LAGGRRLNNMLEKRKVLKKAKRDGQEGEKIRAGRVKEP